jgi:hypothetical protein
MILGSIEDEKCLLTLNFMKYLSSKQVDDTFESCGANVHIKVFYYGNISLVCSNENLDQE